MRAVVWNDEQAKNLNMGISKLMIVTLLIGSTSIISGQSANFNYDYMIDNYPKINSLSIEESSGIKMRFCGEFIEAIELLAEKVFNPKIKVNRLSGMLMSSSGIYPKQLMEVHRWLKIVVDENGTVEVLEVYKGNGKKNIENTDEFEKLLEEAEINPATKDGVKVKCVLYYQIESE